MSVTFVYRQKWISVFVPIRSVFANSVTNVFITLQVNIVLIVGLKFYFDLSDVTYTQSWGRYF